MQEIEEGLYNLGMDEKPERRTIDVTIETRDLLKIAAAKRRITMTRLIAKLAEGVDEFLPLQKPGGTDTPPESEG